MHVSCCVFLYTYACYNVLVFQKIGFFLGVFKKCCGFLKRLGFSKNVGCPGIFREIKGNTPKCPGRQTSQVGMYDNCMGVCHEFFSGSVHTLEFKGISPYFQGIWHVRISQYKGTSEISCVLTVTGGSCATHGQLGARSWTCCSSKSCPQWATLLPKVEWRWAQSLALYDKVKIQGGCRACVVMCNI